LDFEEFLSPPSGELGLVLTTPYSQRLIKREAVWNRWKQNIGNTDGVNVQFWKLSGAGNDFVTFDNRELSIADDAVVRGPLVRNWCARRTGIGADGVLMIEPSSVADFRMRYYNADGGEVETCGNGARCIARLAHLLGAAQEQMRFETNAGIYEALVDPDWVRVSMSDATGLVLNAELSWAQLPAYATEQVFTAGEPCCVDCVNTGVPHAVVMVQNVTNAPVVALGRAIRKHPYFAPAGTNANFVSVEGKDHLRIRTYERGVEDETLACGTGCIASAIIAVKRELVQTPVRLTTQSGVDLTINFELTETGARSVTLQGEARVVFAGEM
jgi:diaminopimelate epimerase